MDFHAKQAKLLQSKVDKIKRGIMPKPPSSMTRRRSQNFAVLLEVHEILRRRRERKMREQVNKQREQQPAGNLDIDHMTVSVGFPAFHCPPVLTGSAQVSHAWLVPVPALTTGLWSIRKTSGNGSCLSNLEIMKMDGNWPAILGTIQRRSPERGRLEAVFVQDDLEDRLDQLSAISTSSGQIPSHRAVAWPVLAKSRKLNKLSTPFSRRSSQTRVSGEHTCETLARQTHLTKLGVRRRQTRASR